MVTTNVVLVVKKDDEWEYEFEMLYGDLSEEREVEILGIIVCVMVKTVVDAVASTSSGSSVVIFVGFCVEEWF